MIERLKDIERKDRQADIDRNNAAKLRTAEREASSAKASLEALTRAINTPDKSADALSQIIALCQDIDPRYTTRGSLGHPGGLVVAMHVREICGQALTQAHALHESFKNRLPDAVKRSEEADQSLARLLAKLEAEEAVA